MPGRKKQTERRGCFVSILSLFGIEVKEREPSPTTRELPYRLRDDFLSPAEISFFHILRAWAGDRYIVCSKVSLSDLFFVVRPNVNIRAYNRINRKHVDFVVCEPGTVKPLLAIELDDSSHARPDRAARDAFVDKVFAAAGLPLLHVPARLTYNTEDVAGLLNRRLNLPDDASSHAEGNTKPESARTDEAPFCPKCGERMLLRIAKTGAQAGRQFYGCPNYPKCRVVLPVGG